jgi:hypothetical protein
MQNDQKLGSRIIGNVSLNGLTSLLETAPVQQLLKSEKEGQAAKRFDAFCSVALVSDNN